MKETQMDQVELNKKREAELARLKGELEEMNILIHASTTIKVYNELDIDPSQS